MSPSNRFAALVVAILVGLASGVAGARSSDRNKPMDIDADHGTLSAGSDGQTVLTGNVRITQGTLNVNSAKAVITLASGEITRAQFSGGSRLRQQLDDGTDMDVTAANVDYDLRTEVVVFTGDVEIRQQRGTLNGQRVVYNMKTGQVESGGSGNGRVKMRILPKGAQAQPAGTGG